MIIYVNAAASREGNGSKAMPFKHINEAARIAKPGDEVLVAPGIYREYVDPVNAGTENNRITYRSEVPLGAVITGAEEVKCWKPYEGNTWVCRIDNGIFGSYNPYTTIVGGDWYFAPVDRHTGAVYLNGRHLYEAETLEECLKAPNVIRARMTRYNLTCRTKSELLKEEQVELSKLLNGEIGTDCYQYSCTPELSFVCYDQNQIRGCLLLKELEKNRMQIDIYVNIGGEATIVTLMRSLFDTLEKSGREGVVLQFVAINDDILRALTFLTEIPEDEYRVDSMKYAALAL